MGSPLVRTLMASDRAALPPGPVEQHIETMIKLFRAVRSQAMDAGVKFALENHKDLLCWQTRQVIEGAGKEFVGSYLDTGNPVFVMEDPMETVETLGPVAVTFHLRDSVVYETRNGIAVQWVPLGDGVVDFKTHRRARQRDSAAGVRLHQAHHRPAARDSAHSGDGILEEVARQARRILRPLPGAGQERPSLRARDGD